ncbi:hypothetical protein NQ317_019476 [Molorchus minor]|uniref:Small ribosomal subunit protein mS39 n=1 Tax=Molorchus minor TaxID=1323400 RepID=A0ABQ9JNM3_9CUCU|nr:hypothetical protein NQ317_019476 [Molorchus minor]
MNISTLFFKRSNIKPLIKHIYIPSQKFSTDVQEKIEIPNRIPRGPTDILRALESTISRDPTAAHYKYHDDPYLIPMSNVGKRTFAMAQEAGKKAAHWIRKEHADLFNHREADPVIKAFLPRVSYDENSEVTEEDLKISISDVQVSDAQLVYRLLKSKGIEISPETQLQLLELVCYFNSEDTLSEEFIEERWFRQSSRFKDRQRKTWKDGSFAEELFIGIENPTAETYSALILGMSKHFQVERAYQLFEEAQQKGLILSTNTYNSLINVVNFLKENYEMRWTFIVDLLTDMNKVGQKPNLGTLNAVLHALSQMGSGKNAKDSVLKTLREFKDLGIEPSLGSWYYVLITYCKERGPVSTILNDIMPQIENKEHQARDLADTNFFVTAMDICRNHLHDIDLAKRVDTLLHFANNYNLIGDSYKESIYYRHYFILLINSLPLEEFMNEVYYKLVPNIYVPEPSVMTEVLKQVDLNGETEYIPKLWSDMTIFDHTSRENLIDTVLNIMINNEPPIESELTQKFADIGWNIYEKIDTQDENRFNKLSFTGDLLGNIMALALRNNDFGKACIIMDKLDKEHNKIVGVPKMEVLSLFVDHCIVQKSPSRAIACIQYCADAGFPEAGDLAARLTDTLTLNEKHIHSLVKIVGELPLAGKINVRAD